MSFFFPTPTPVFPVLQSGYPAKLKPTFSTAVQTAVSGVEIRTARQLYPLWEFELTFEALRDQTQNILPDLYNLGKTDLEKIVGLFLMCRGQYGRFYYSCPEDNSRVGTNLGTTDGTTSTYRVQRFWGSQLAAEPVSVDNSNPIHIYLDGVEDTFNWSVTDNNTTFTRSSPPTAGQVLTASFHFFYLCRFIEDLEDFDQFYYHLWQLKSLKFRSVKQ